MAYRPDDPYNTGIGTPDLGLGNINQGQNVQTAGILPTWLGGATKEEEALKQIQDYRKDQAPYKGLIDADILQDYPKKQKEWQEIENKIQDLKKQYPGDVGIQSAYLDDDESDFYNEYGYPKTAFLDPISAAKGLMTIGTKIIPKELMWLYKKEAQANTINKGLKLFKKKKKTSTITGGDKKIIKKKYTPPSHQTGGSGGVHSGMKTTKKKYTPPSHQTGGSGGVHSGMKTTKTSAPQRNYSRHRAYGLKQGGIIDKPLMGRSRDI